MSRSTVSEDSGRPFEPRMGADVPEERERSVRTSSASSPGMPLRPNAILVCSKGRKCTSEFGTIVSPEREGIYEPSVTRGETSACKRILHSVPRPVPPTWGQQMPSTAASESSPVAPLGALVMYGLVSSVTHALLVKAYRLPTSRPIRRHCC